MANCESFSPSIDNRSRVLILGSMPGVKSLCEQQYYANPQNRFWRLMGKFCGCDLVGLDYDKKLKTLLDNGFALWDVIKSCQRSGSLDSNIQDEVPNDIEGLLKKYTGIEKICLNGSKAYAAFWKHFPELSGKYECFKLPSTSAANAGCRFEGLYEEWRRVVG